jgi:hypothetical protein
MSQPPQPAYSTRERRDSFLLRDWAIRRAREWRRIIDCLVEYPGQTINSMAQHLAVKPVVEPAPVLWIE